MKRANRKKTLMEIDVDGSGRCILRYGRLKYDETLKLYTIDHDLCLALADFASWPTKREALAAAKERCIPTSHVARIGSRSWSAWGIQYSRHEPYFFIAASKKMTESGRKAGLPHRLSGEKNG